MCFGPSCLLSLILKGSRAASRSVGLSSARKLCTEASVSSDLSHLCKPWAGGRGLHRTLTRTADWPLQAAAASDPLSPRCQTSRSITPGPSGSQVSVALLSLSVCAPQPCAPRPGFSRGGGSLFLACTQGGALCGLG